MTEIIEKTFTVGVMTVLKVINIRGSVKITSGEDGFIDVKAILQPYSGDKNHTKVEIFQETDGTVKVTTRFPVVGCNFMKNSIPCEVDYMIKVPHNCSFQVNGVSNSILAQGVKGKIHVKSVNGETKLFNLAGQVSIHTVSGSVSGKCITGSLNFDTVSGDIDISESCITSVKANSISGNANLQTSITEGPYNFISVSGNFYLIIPSDARCSAELKSFSGGLFSTLPVTSSTRQHGLQICNINGGGAQIKLQSVSGDLSLESKEENSLNLESLKLFTRETRQVVLGSLECGELTIEQALSRLQL